MTSLIEQETTVTRGKADDVVRIWTNIASDARRLEKDPRVTKVKGNSDDVGGFYEIPADQWSVTGGFKRRSKPLTAEQRAALAERLNASLGRDV